MTLRLYTPGPAPRRAIGVAAGCRRLAARVLGKGEDDVRNMQTTTTQHLRAQNERSPKLRLLRVDGTRVTDPIKQVTNQGVS
jgi:hypothetical protein